MKNIVIAGVPRAGKSTLSKILAEELENYHLINLDAVRNGFGDIFPELDINDMGGKNNTVEFPRFVSRMIYWNQKILKNKFSYIIDGCQILPEVAEELFPDSIIIYLGHGNRGPQEILENIRKNDTPDEYSYHRSDERMLDSINRNIEFDKDLQEKCELYKIKYIDTFDDREKKLRNIADEIENSIYIMN